MVCLETNSSNDPGGNNLQPIACYQSDPNTNSLGGDQFKNSNITKELCLDFCKRGMYSYAGIYAGANACYCGNLLPDESKKLTGLGLNCDRTCPGDNHELKGGCGGSYRMSFYKF